MRPARIPGLSYANVWEDPLLLLSVFPQGARLFSIASGGDNTLALLTLRPSLVAAVDMNPVQLKLLELKAAVVRTLDRAEALVFLGFRCGERQALFTRVRGALSPEAGAWWDARYPLVETGLIHAGKFEGYFRAFRRFVLPLMMPGRDLASLLLPRTEAERRLFFSAYVDTRRWRLLFRLFFSRALMGRLGREPAHFRYVADALAPALMERAEHALTALDPRDNPFLEYILTGSFERNLPLYMQEPHYSVIRNNMEALRILPGRVEDVLGSEAVASMDGFNLSDVFEYMGEEEARRNFLAIARAGRPGARLAYWNMAVPRLGSLLVPERLRLLAEPSRSLFARDRAFFYRAFRVEEVL